MKLSILRDKDMSDNKNAESSMRLDCRTGFGATSHVTATFAFFAVAHAIKKLLAKHKER